MESIFSVNWSISIQWAPSPSPDNFVRQRPRRQTWGVLLPRPVWQEGGVLRLTCSLQPVILQLLQPPRSSSSPSYARGTADLPQSFKIGSATREMGSQSSKRYFVYALYRMYFFVTQPPARTEKQKQGKGNTEIAAATHYRKTRRRRNQSGSGNSIYHGPWPTAFFAQGSGRLLRVRRGSS